jgi:eukaryotic-like serine/threonine-protein kinase
LIETGSHERLGNFSYSAPEQRKRGGIVDHRADIFALGLILNEMFTGHVPQGSGYTQIGAVNQEYSYLDTLVEKMIRQQPHERLQSIRQVKETLISLGHRFIEFQRLDALKKEVVSETDLIDPIVLDPIRPIQKLDYAGEILSLRLNQKMNEKWEKCFRARATAYNTNFHQGMINFSGDIAYLRVNEYHAPLAYNMFKQFCESANDEYLKVVTEEHREELNRQKGELFAARVRQEQKMRVLGNIPL